MSKAIGALAIVGIISIVLGAGWFVAWPAYARSNCARQLADLNWDTLSSKYGVSKTNQVSSPGAFLNRVSIENPDFEEMVMDACLAQHGI
jgi:hypothetical protein